MMIDDTDNDQQPFEPDFADPPQWAAMYRRAGFQVVPANNHRDKPGNWKNPALPQWKQLQHEIVPELTFRRWYGEGGEHARRINMGMLTGACSRRAFVVDLDTHKKPESLTWWNRLLAEHNYGGELETMRQTTGGGGKQLLFEAPGDWTAPTIKTSLGVDIRGQGGFAMLPPSTHDSGKRYQWDEGFEPWVFPLTIAPPWLCAEIDALAEEFGGSTRTAAGERTASPNAETNEFGRVVDGREDLMTRMVWGRVVDLYRDCPIQPDAETLFSEFTDLLATYHRTVKTRMAGVDNAAGLEREGRGATALAEHWRRALRKWETDVAEAAGQPRPFDAGTGEGQKQSPPEPEIDPVTGQPKPLILTAAEFVAGFTPPQYLIDGMIQRGYLYSLTARTGHGKTAVAMFLAQAIARGEAIRKREVQQGGVLILAGENPDDVRARFLVLAESHGFDPADIPIHFIAGVVNIEEMLPVIRAEAGRIDKLMLVIVDTAAAYFRGDDGNSNVQAGNFARVLRELSFLPGKPAVIVNSHPVKNASKDNLLPVGGGAFLNEVDGNLTLWSEGDNTSILHWQGKFRGPEFEPMTFKIQTAHADAVHDHNGNLMPSVVARPISDLEAEQIADDTANAKRVLLAVIGGNPPLSVAKLAVKANFVDAEGKAQKSKVHRLCLNLRDNKLVQMDENAKWVLTEKGRSKLELKQ